MQHNVTAYVEQNNVNTELNVKLPEYFTDNVRQHTTIQNEIVETELQREIRQSKDAARAAARRRRESSPEKRKRLSQSAAHIAMKRKKESMDQRKMRLAKDAARTAERRRKETFAERETRLAIDAARHATKRRHPDDDIILGSPNDVHTDVNNNNPSIRITYAPSSNATHQTYRVDGMPRDHHNTSSSSTLPPPEDNQQKPRPHGIPSTRNESKYGNLLNVIEDLGREIRPTYAGSKMSQDRLRKGIMHARELVRGCLAEVEKKMR